MNIPVGDRRWQDILKSGDNQITEQRLRSGEWLIFMIGIDENGELSGFWQCLELTIEREIPTADYLKWIGTWSVSDKDGKKLFDVTITECESNMWYYLAGWERNNILGYDTSDDSWRVETFYDKSAKTMVFVSQYIKTVEGDEAIDFYMTASTLYGTQNYIVPRDPQNIKLAAAQFYDAPTCSKATISGLDFMLGGQAFPLTELFLAGYNMNQAASISMPTPALPLMMEKKE